MDWRSLDFTVHFLIVKDGSQYSALCYEYNLATCARTVEAAFTDLMDATISYLELYLDKGQRPEPRPASRELMLEFLDLDSERESFTKEELDRVFASAYGGTVRLESPLVYSRKARGFTTPLKEALPRPRTGSYQVAICHA